MREIGAIEPADGSLSVEEHPPPDRDGRKPPARPHRRRHSAEDMVEVEPHKLDVEA